MAYEWRIGTRYLRSTHRRGFVSFVALMSVIGLALGVAVLQGGSAWWWRSALLIATRFLTLPLAAHALARVAARKRTRPSTKRGA